MNMLCLISPVQSGQWKLEIKLKNKVFVMLAPNNSFQLFKSQNKAISYAQSLGFIEANMKLM